MKISIPADAEATVEIASDQTVTVTFAIDSGEILAISVPLELADSLCGTLDEALNEYEREEGSEEEEE